MRENIVKFTDNYDLLQGNLSTIKELINSLNSRAKLKSFG
jgi:hypothetical protein